jgi:putative transposase
LNEVRDPCGICKAARDLAIKKLQRQKKKQESNLAEVITPSATTETSINQPKSECEEQISNPFKEAEDETPTATHTPAEKPKKPVPYVRVYDNYEQVRREANPL